jgi:hypothetical protein
MWQVVSGTSNLLSDRALQAAVPTITSGRRGVVQSRPGHGRSPARPFGCLRTHWKSDPPGEAMPLIVRGQMHGCLDLTEMDTLHRGEAGVVLAESARAVFAAGLPSNVPDDERGAGLIKRLGSLEMSMEGLDAE